MKVNNCCGCWSLKTGTIVIGVLTVISAAINIITIGTTLGQMNGVNMTDNPFIVLKMIIVSGLMYVIASATFGVLMIVGAVRGVPSLVFPWLACGLSNIVGTICVGLGVIITISTVIDVGMLFGILALCSFCLTLQMYLWLVVYSNYKGLVSAKYGDAKSSVTSKDGKIFSQSMNPYNHV